MTTAEESVNPAVRLGFQAGQVVQELGGGQDVDQDLRAGIVSITGKDLVDEDSDEVADIVLLWFREEDGELSEALNQAIIALEEDGELWLVTPKVGRAGYIQPSDIGESATVSGLTQRASVNAGADWIGTRFAPPPRR
ncbi:DUF3052 domain-containing protein [Nocardiopsis sp. CT-R113]|uniref:DUF3052 domain-containing protein n=1 Tax=Nocardiopsis codii TaxID=3065942 RepID=A0ABU7KF67_9ACTN|nr:DUF3052 domain-containing protein [Nocardiopsis sp. CT-R113]MEE2040884.1 DUF3052 domain-containing protein [Nocardiopsis sp. CT-R113]